MLDFAPPVMSIVSNFGMSMILSTALRADFVTGHPYDVPQAERGPGFMSLPLMKQTLPNFVKLLVGRDPCTDEIDRTHEYRAAIFPRKAVRTLNCREVLTPSVCSFPTTLIKTRTSPDSGLDVLEMGCTLQPRPIRPLLIHFVVLNFLLNKWVEHDLDKASNYREIFKNDLRFQSPVLDAFGRLPYSGILDQKQRGALADEMEHLTLAQDDLMPMFFVLEFRTRVQLEVLANMVSRKEISTWKKDYSFQINFDGFLSVGAKRTPQNINDFVTSTTYNLVQGDTLLLDHPMYPVPDSVENPFDLIMAWPTVATGPQRGNELVKPAQILFQRGKRLFAVMGVMDTPAAAGQGYPDPAKASTALTDGLLSTS